MECALVHKTELAGNRVMIFVFRKIPSKVLGFYKFTANERIRKRNHLGQKKFPDSAQSR